MRQSKKVTFKGSRGVDLAGRLELPSASSGICAILAHCFTCSKDGAAASRISWALAERGIAVLRFDFTGLGSSDGDFGNTTFSSNVQDLLAAADYLREHIGPPKILVGHSLGGAAVLVAAHEIRECKLVATVGAPSDPAHIKRLMTGSIEDVERHGSAEVVIGGRTFTITKQFLDDLKRQQHDQLVSELNRALMVFHSPTDSIVSVDNAREIYLAAKHPKSFVALDNADHLLTNRADADYVGAVLAAWANRYLPQKNDETAA
jgi:putative redox protein